MADVRRGDIWYCELSEAGQFVQKGKRPAVVVQSNKGNAHSGSVVVIPLTSQLKRLDIPTNVELDHSRYVGILNADSVAQCNQIRTIDMEALDWYMGSCRPADMVAIEEGVKIALDL